MKNFISMRRTQNRSQFSSPVIDTWLPHAARNPMHPRGTNSSPHHHWGSIKSPTTTPFHKRICSSCMLVGDQATAVGSELSDFALRKPSSSAKNFSCCVRHLHHKHACMRRRGRCSVYYGGEVINKQLVFRLQGPQLQKRKNFNSETIIFRHPFVLRGSV